MDNDSRIRALKKALSRPLYQHSLSVARYAAELGKKGGWDPEQAYQAGLFHDWAKEWSHKKLRQYVRKNKVRLPDLPFVLKNAPDLLHAYAGAFDLKKQGWVTNRVTLAAIAHHTLGSPGMSLPEKILYVADIASPDRQFKGAQDIRRLAKKNLNAGFLSAVALKISYVVCQGKLLHPMTLTLWNEAVLSLQGRL